MNINRQTVQLGIIGLMAVVSFGLVVWSNITHTALSSDVETLLGVVLGFIGSQVSSQQGSEQALSTPVPPPVVATVAPTTDSVRATVVP